MSKHDGRVRCDHCGGLIRNARDTVLIESVSWDFHGDRRACRRAKHETWETMRIDPPEDASQVDTRVLGAALVGFDYVRLPWWLRWVPGAWLDHFGFEVAVKVGGIVERHIAVKAMGLGDDDA